MSLFTVWFMLLMLHATTHAQLCPEGHYCPAGADCSSDKNLCIAGVCSATAKGTCEEVVLVEFESPSYEVSEDYGVAQIAVVLDGPLDCCSVAVTVRIDDGTAKRYQDYSLLSPDPKYVTVRFRAGEIRATFDVYITDDDQLEDGESFSATIYDLSVPYGVTLGSLESVTVTIVDDDRTTLSFSRSSFYADENDGQALPELALSVPAPFDFTVYISSFNEHLSDQCDEFSTVEPSYEVQFPKWTTKKEFPVNITDDDVYEGDESFTLSIDNSLPSRITLGQPDMAEIVIVDDEDLITASFEQPLYKVTEHQGSIAPRLVLSKPSPCCFILHAKVAEKTAKGRCLRQNVVDLVFVIDTSGSIGSSNFQLIREFTANIITELINSSHNSTVGVILFSSSAYIKFNLRTYTSLNALLSAINELPYDHGASTETDEALSLLLSAAQDGTLRLRSGSTKVAIVVTDGLSSNRSATLSAAAALRASNIFDVYAVGVGGAYVTELEGIASSPEFVFFASSFDSDGLQQLRDRISRELCTGGNADFGYISKIYNYTFHAGSTCASPDGSISIIDDKIEENIEHFEISIMDHTLPFGCKAGSPAIISITDNDNVVYFRHDECSVREDNVNGVTIELLLAEPARSDRQIYVYSQRSDDTAKADADYQSGPYNVTFNQGETSQYLTIPIIDDNSYEGEEYFIIYLDNLPHGVVLGYPHTANVIIEDDEYAVCFERQRYSVEEGDRIKLDLTLTRSLPNSLTVSLEYSNEGSTSSSDYYASPRSVTFRAGTTAASIYVSTREDHLLEPDESYRITVKHASLPSNAGCDYCVINIKDDDDHKLKFERSEYRSTERSPAKPRLVLNKTPEFTFTVRVVEEDGTAKGGKDYVTNRYNVRFEKGGSRYGELTTKKIDDEYVEDDECYSLKIQTGLLPDDVVIDGPDTTTIILVNEDVTTVIRSNEVLNFSKPLSFDVEVIASYYSGISDQKKTLSAGQKQINFDSLTINQLQRITITVPCGLQRNDFIIRTSRIYLTGPSRTCPPSNC